MSDQTKTVFDELPAIESVVTMTATEKAEWQTKLDAALTEQGLTYQKAEKQYQEAKAAYDQAYEAFERDYAGLIETRKTAAQQADQLKAQLQRGAAFRRALTGEASWQAFQAAETWKPVYDDNAMLTWIVDEAPRATALTLLALNKTAVNKFVTNRREENRSTVKALEGCAPIPPLAKRKSPAKSWPINCHC